MIYPENIAFIVNLDNAKSSDVHKTVIFIEKIMKSKYNINIILFFVMLSQKFIN